MDNIDLHIMIIDDNPKIHQDFIKVLTFTNTKNELHEFEKQLFDEGDLGLNESTDLQTDYYLPKFIFDTANQGREGVDKIKKALKNGVHYSLAFVDIKMPPGWDGIETITQMWKIDPDIQIIICTAYSDYSWEETVKQLGMGDNYLILKKPFDAVAVKQLACALTKKWVLEKESKLHKKTLQQTIDKRTESLQQSLKEKEEMLKEIYHRVKNNLQVVNSLLNLQAKSIKDEASRKMFIESSTRVKAMGLVHEMLYRSGNLTCIEMGKYASELFRHLNEIYKTNNRSIQFRVESDGTELNLETAVPCGLILNELISNAFKYAFPDERSGEITFRIAKKDNNVVLIFADDGIGFPPEVDFKHTSTLGLKLINNLTKQLDGTLIIDGTKGTVFILTLPGK